MCDVLSELIGRILATANKKTGSSFVISVKDTSANSVQKG